MHGYVLSNFFLVIMSLTSKCKDEGKNCLGINNS